jgi:hypothetical protein
MRLVISKALMLGFKYVSLNYHQTTLLEWDVLKLCLKRNQTFHQCFVLNKGHTILTQV